MTIERTADNEFRLVAIHPGEMESCQASLLEWCERKIAFERKEEEDLQKNYEAAVAHKWKSSTLKRHLDIAGKRVVYYCKIRDAVKAGYYMVPNFPVDVFAVRTDKKKPTTTPRWGRPGYGQWNANSQVKDEKPKMLTSGDGQYVNPDVPVVELGCWDTRKDDKGNEVKTYVAQADDEYDAIDFPFVLAKTEVLEATARAMALKVFDEIGVLPGVRHQRKVRDPLIAGRILGPKGLSCMFMVAWWLDTKSL